MIRKIFFSFFFLCGGMLLLPAQTPDPALVGYWHNWDDVNVPYIPLDQVDNLLEISFAVPEAGTDYKIVFIPDGVSPATFATQVQNLQAAGKKVLISIGGATAPVSLDNTAERDTFILRMGQILNAYQFDGMDIDLEGASLAVTGGTISNPVDAPVVHLIEAVKQIMVNYRSVYNRKMLLTMAPETAFVQGGMSAFGAIWGAYLPVIDALRDSLDILQVQLYNSGTMYGIDGGIYTQGTADFIVAMTEAVIQGFNTSGGFFQGLPPDKVAVGLPACALAAGGGFTDTATVAAAIQYLKGSGPQPGVYVLSNPSGYPNLRGMMTWSVNWDALNACGGTYTFADNYEQLFGTVTHTASFSEIVNEIQLFPVPATEVLYLTLGSDSNSGSYIVYDVLGNTRKSGNYSGSKIAIDVSDLSDGVYFLKGKGQIKKMLVQH